MIYANFTCRHKYARAALLLLLCLQGCTGKQCVDFEASQTVDFKGFEPSEIFGGIIVEYADTSNVALDTIALTLKNVHPNTDRYSLDNGYINPLPGKRYDFILSNNRIYSCKDFKIEAYVCNKRIISRDDYYYNLGQYSINGITVHSGSIIINKQ